ncbi:hypothetical protein [Streptomyces sp. NPDC000880]
MSTAYPFPDELRALQLQLDRVRAEYEQHCRSLPWSVEPMIGRAYERPLMGAAVETVTFPDSPGYTPEQIDADRLYRSRLLELATEILMHEWWAEVPQGEKVAARMALRHIGDEQPATAGAAAPAQ